MSRRLRLLVRAAVVAVGCGYTEPVPEDVVKGHAARSLQTSPCAGPQTLGELLQTITASPYDPKSRPNISGAATLVQVQLYLTSITHIDEKRQKVGISGYFRTWWDDHRLAFNSTSDGGCFDEMNIAKSDWARLWRPDLYFDNSLDEDYGANMFFVYPSGRIWSSIRIEHYFECTMFFGRLPYDEQKCTILIASYSENANNVYVKPFADVEGLKTKACYTGTMAWDITDVKSHLETKWFGEEGSRYPWTYVHLDLYVKRHSLFYIREYVGKGVLFVLTSWCGFFINPNNAPARVAIGVIPLLTITTYLQAIYDMLPVISYWTWLTSYIALCMVYCTIPIFEYALVCYLLRVEESRADKLSALRSLGSLKALKTAAVFNGLAVDDQRRQGRLQSKKKFSAVTPRLTGMFVRKEDSVESRDSEGIFMKTDRPSPSSDLEGTPQVDHRGTPDSLEIVPPNRAPVSLTTTSEPCSRSWNRDSPRAPAAQDGAGSPRLPVSRFAGIRLTPLQHKMVQEAWENIDSDGSGEISIKELRQRLRNFGQFFTMSQAAEIFDKLNLEETGGMNKRKFLEFLANFDEIAPTNVLSKNLRDQPPSRQVDTVIRISFLITFIIWTLCWSFTVSSFNNYNSEALQCSA